MTKANAQELLNTDYVVYTDMGRVTYAEIICEGIVWSYGARASDPFVTYWEKPPKLLAENQHCVYIEFKPSQNTVEYTNSEFLQSNMEKYLKY